MRRGLKDAAETAVFIARACPDDSEELGAIQRGLLEDQVRAAGTPERLVPLLADLMIREARERVAE